MIDTSEPFVLIGTSLGGLVVIELSQIVSPHKIILIASVKSRDELPLFIRAMKFLHLHRLIPGSFYKKMNGLMIKRLGDRGDAEAARVIREMMETANPAFIEWAIDAAIHWQSPQNIPNNIIHIHGSADRLFPIRNIKGALVVEKGSHIMNITKSTGVNGLILRALAD
jgi:pimeloyl-ACP methyl ester carboxylesterase